MDDAEKAWQSLPWKGGPKYVTGASATSLKKTPRVPIDAPTTLN